LIQEVMDVFRKAFRVNTKFFFTELAGKEDLDKVGREFTTWLWFKSRQKDGQITMNGEDYTVNFIRRMVLESGAGEMTETVVCSGLNFDLNEAKGALRQGKKVKDARIRIEKDSTAWEFGYKGDSFQFQSVKLPVSAEVGENETPEGRNLERLFMISSLTDVMDELFKMFLLLRMSTEWEREKAAMWAWIEEE
jgi:hypothetical protein